MADRYFENNMPDYTPEKSTATTTLKHEDEELVEEEDLLFKLLSMPDPTLSERFKRAALDLKETIMIETWGETRQRVKDFTLYSGTLGTAFFLFRAFQITSSKNDLTLCLEIVKACDPVSLRTGGVTFICGRAGVCALGAVAAKYAGNKQLLDHYLLQFKKITLPRDVPNELLYGRAGYLWACLFLNRHIGDGTISPSHTGAVVNDIIQSGRTMGQKSSCPLMYEWYGEKYWGAAHGLAGIMHVLMHMPLKPDQLQDVKRTLKYLIENRFPSGNYAASEDDRRRDTLVHWCHGAPGIALTFVKAAEVFEDKQFLEAAADAAEVVWNRGLLKRVGLCHGISGNAYVFLSLYRLTGNIEFLYRAKAFASFLLERGQRLICQGLMHGGDNPYSLFEGIGGMAYLFLDMTEPTDSRFPAYEL
ncbi:Lanthionine synthetase C-like [Dillenia turbinata]|uniref:Lanthionine synthetase C-like n=1 Tax=Dillenia turbinata TaxID=194707 RepID=A0AAN8Z382_9MAGN